MQFLNYSAKRTYKYLLKDLFVKNLASLTIPLVSETSHMFVFKFFATKIAIPPFPLLTEPALYERFYFFTIVNKSQVFYKFEIPQFLSKMCILKFTNKYKLAIPTIPLVS